MINLNYYSPCSLVKVSLLPSTQDSQHQSGCFSWVNHSEIKQRNIQQSFSFNATIIPFHCRWHTRRCHLFRHVRLHTAYSSSRIPGSSNSNSPRSHNKACHLLEQYSRDGIIYQSGDHTRRLRCPQWDTLRWRIHHTMQKRSGRSLANRLCKK